MELLLYDIKDIKFKENCRYVFISKSNSGKTVLVK